jgi:hypothetical protein
MLTVKCYLHDILNLKLVLVEIIGSINIVELLKGSSFAFAPFFFAAARALGKTYRAQEKEPYLEMIWIASGLRTVGRVFTQRSGARVNDAKRRAM